MLPRSRAPVPSHRTHSGGRGTHPPDGAWIPGPGPARQEVGGWTIRRRSHGSFSGVPLGHPEAFHPPGRRRSPLTLRKSQPLPSARGPRGAGRTWQTGPPKCAAFTQGYRARMSRRAVPRPWGRGREAPSHGAPHAILVHSTQDDPRHREATRSAFSPRRASPRGSPVVLRDRFQRRTETHGRPAPAPAPCPPRAGGASHRRRRKGSRSRSDRAWDRRRTLCLPCQG